MLDVVANLTTTSPGVSLRSNIFNATTWRGLSDETWALIAQSEKSWIHEYRNSSWYRFDVTLNGANYQVDAGRLFQLLESAVDLTSGGDIWQKLRVMHETSKLKPLLTLAEDMPNLLITAVDTFVSSERLDDFLKKLFVGQVHLCDVDRYLLPPSYMRKRGLLSSITNFCQKILMSGNDLTWTDILPFDEKYDVTFFFFSELSSTNTRRHSRVTDLEIKFLTFRIIASRQKRRRPRTRCNCCEGCRDFRAR